MIMNFNSLVKNKLFIGSLCVLIALVFAFVIIPISNAGTRKTVIVIVPKVTIVQNTVITKDMLTTEIIGSYGIPKDVIKNIDAIVGKIANTKLYNGMPMVPDELSSLNSNSQFLYDVKDGERAISITIPTLSAGVSGNLMVGDVVCVKTFVDNTNIITSSSKSQTADGFITGNIAGAAKSAYLYPQLKYLRISAITSINGQSLNKNNNNATTSSVTTAQSTSQSTILTFVCTEEQATLLENIHIKGDAYVEFIARGKAADKITGNQTSSSSTASSVS